MGMKKIFCLVLLTFLFLLAGNVNTLAIEDDEDELFNNPVIIRDGISVSIFDCVASAFKNSPRIRKQKYNLDIAKSNLGIARSQYFPVINAGAGFYNENNSDNIYYNSHYRELPTVGVTVNKLVWNFGKTTAYIKMEDVYKIGAEYEFMDSLCSTLFDVKAKYYALLRAKAMLQIAQNNVEINENIYENIQNNVCRFNEESNKPYELSFSIGICRNSNQPLDKFLNFMDLAMYQEKSRYYEEGCHNRRVR